MAKKLIGLYRPPRDKFGRMMMVVDAWADIGNPALDEAGVKKMFKGENLSSSQVEQLIGESVYRVTLDRQIRKQREVEHAGE